MSKVLIVFYSRSGKTRKVANDMAGKLGADVEEIIDRKKRTGILGFLTGGRDAMKKNMTEIEPMSKNPADYDVVIVGSPVWGNNMAPAIRTFFNQKREGIRKYAFFVTSGDTDPALVAKSVVEILGKSPIAITGWSAKELAAKIAYEEKMALFINNIQGNL